MNNSNELSLLIDNASKKYQWPEPSQELTARIIRSATQAQDQKGFGFFVVLPINFRSVMMAGCILLLGMITGGAIVQNPVYASGPDLYVDSNIMYFKKIVEENYE